MGRESRVRKERVVKGIEPKTVLYTTAEEHKQDADIMKRMSEINLQMPGMIVKP